MSGVTEVERELLWRTARIRTVDYPEGRHDLVPQILAYLAQQSAAAMNLLALDRLRRGARSDRRTALPSAGATTSGDPRQFQKALYVRIAGRGIRLDVAWTDRASHAKAWRDSDAGAETTIGPALLLPFSELHERLLTAAWSGRLTVSYVGGLLAAVLPAPLISKIASLPADRPVVLALSAESEPLPGSGWSSTALPSPNAMPSYVRPLA